MAGFQALGGAIALEVRFALVTATQQPLTPAVRRSSVAPAGDKLLPGYHLKTHRVAEETFAKKRCRYVKNVTNTFIAMYSVDVKVFTDQNDVIRYNTCVNRD